VDATGGPAQRLTTIRQRKFRRGGRLKVNGFILPLTAPVAMKCGKSRPTALLPKFRSLVMGDGPRR
jgi:hypothetical protein